MTIAANNCLLITGYPPLSLSLQPTGRSITKLSHTYQSSSSNKIRNRRVKSSNGNGKTTLKIIHCNYGPRHWVNKIADVEALALQHKPDIIFVSESNLFVGDDHHQTKIDGYELYSSKTHQTQLN